MSYRQYVFILVISLIAVVGTPGWLALVDVPLVFGMLSLLPVFALWTFLMFRLNQHVRRRLNPFTITAWTGALQRGGFDATPSGSYRGAIADTQVDIEVRASRYEQSVEVRMRVVSDDVDGDLLVALLKGDQAEGSDERLLHARDEATREAVERLKWTMRTLTTDPTGALKFESDALVEQSGAVGFGVAPSEIVAQLEQVIRSLVSTRPVDARLKDMALTDRDAEFRRAACHRLKELIGAEALRAWLEQEVDQIRSSACAILCEFGGPRLRQRTIDIVLEPTVSLDDRLDAAVAVEGPLSGSTAVWNELWTSTNLSVQAASVKRALEVGIVPLEEAFDEALVFYRTGRHLMIRRLAELTSDAVSVRRFVDSKHPAEVRVEAIRALGRIGGREDVDLIRKQIRGLVNTDIEMAASRAVSSIQSRLEGGATHGLAVLETGAGAGELGVVEGGETSVAAAEESFNRRET